MSKGTRRNKHGIPVYDLSVPRESCFWPNCGRIPSTYEASRLCDTHAAHVTKIVDEVRAHEEAEHRAIREAELERLQAQADRLDALFNEQRAKLAVHKPKREEPAPQPVIYYVQIMSHIKIGWTSNLTNRMRQFPPNSQLLAVHPGTRKDEAAIHKRFAHVRSHGREWYPLVPQLLEHIDRVVREHGEPKAVAFGAKPVEVPMPHRWNGTTQLRARSKGSGIRL